MVSTRTYYFETNTTLYMLKHVLRLYNAGSKRLFFYKYIHYRVDGSLKTVGILQFKIRYSPTALKRYLAGEGVVMNVLKPVNKPLVLTHMRIWVLQQYHRILDCEENGVFCFGGRQRSVVNAMQPYIDALMSSCEPVFSDKLPGAKKLWFYKYMLARAKTPV
ncbi:Hypothetical predicted protein [Paramuricea clavata]|uniref:Uncharacterized protein n=1 Tax=Paramuricea clavata TaxID=317549 RepID=A0A6S7FKN6_PARCT|nr:Hypothetical predicted protein [Paramuricea clavata]